MAIKLVERRICDFCERQEASSFPCCLCHKDFCYAHGDSYTPGDRIQNRIRIDLCHDCAEDFAAKLARPIMPAGAYEDVLKLGQLPAWFRDQRRA